MGGSKVCFWLPLFDSLVPMIKGFSVIYRTDIPKTRKEYRAALDTAWNEIEAKLGIPKRSCMYHWKNIKFTYAKLKVLCNSGKISEEDIKLHKDTTRFFDGSLSFLDPHIGGITEANIPQSIHKQINKIFSFKIPQDDEPKSSPFLTHEDIIQAIDKKRKDKEVFDKEAEQRLYNLVENVVKHKLNELFPLSIISVPDSQHKEIQLQLHSELIIEEHNIKKEETDHTIGDVHNMNTADPMEISSNMTSTISGITIVGGQVNTMIIEEKPVISSNMTSSISDIDLVGGEVNTMISEDMITEEKPVISNNMINRISDIALVGGDASTMITEEKPVISSNMTSSTSDIDLVGGDVNTMISEDMITEEKPVISNNMTSSISDINLVDGDVNTMITKKKTVISSNITSRISDTNMKFFFAELGEVMSTELSKEKQVLLKGRINNTLLRNISEEE